MTAACIKQKLWDIQGETYKNKLVIGYSNLRLLIYERLSRKT